MSTTKFLPETVHELLHFDSRKNEAFIKKIIFAILGQQYTKVLNHDKVQHAFYYNYVAILIKWNTQTQIKQNMYTLPDMSKW